jgi:hypothetical protein
MPWRSLASLALCAGLLAAGGAALQQWSARAPLFGAAPEPGEGPSPGALPLRALYEPKTHALERADAARRAALGAQGEAREAHARAAAAHARAALATAPASGYAWHLLAWGEHLAGNEARAIAALAASRRWAPYTENLAFLRTRLASRLWPALPAEARARALREMPRARTGAPRLFRRAVAADARYALLARLARGEPS